MMIVESNNNHRKIATNHRKIGKSTCTCKYMYDGKLTELDVVTTRILYHANSLGEKLSSQQNNVII